MKSNNKSSTDKFDTLLFEFAQKNYEPIPNSIHNNIIKTIEKLEHTSKKHLHFSFRHHSYTKLFRNKKK